MNADEISIREKENNIEILNKEKIYLINKIKELKEEMYIQNNQVIIENTIETSKTEILRRIRIK